MKPSLRRDSLEKAARKFAKAEGWYDPCDPVVECLVRFAQRHGAKVRRETVKKAVDVSVQHQCKSGNPRTRCYCAMNIATEIEQALTPRGPEKGRGK